ncbi:MAG: M14/M99 family metallopeptidase [Pseudomonadota bacterium]
MNSNPQGYIKRILFFATALCIILPGFVQAQKRIHSVFFEGTDYELHVYRIYGKIPGKTLLLIGGIQGDEPGGYLSVDHYADISLARGNLIVVPRANFQSILLNRRMVNEDMNRKFSEDLKSNYETKIVSILKKLICDSDCLLNLHDGSGFFSEKVEGPDRNPRRYGQSIIVDSETHVNPETGETLQLGAMAKSVSEQVNKSIEDPGHHFHFNNHRTKDNRSPHKEQRKSATFFALYQCGIPAFGIETSKSLPLEMKVRHHNLAINAFMERLDIIPETPGINLDPPVLHYLVVSVNDSLPIVVKNEQTLFVDPGDTVMISHIEANYDRGLSADIVGYGAISDVRKPIRITGPTRIIVRKDYFSCGSVGIELGGNREKLARNVSVSSDPVQNNTFLFFKIRINGTDQITPNHGHIKLIRGDSLELVDVITGYGKTADLEVNFKGYVGDAKGNTGEDRGYVINTARDLWKRYSLDKEGRAYQVIVTFHGDAVGKLFVDLEEPALAYIVLGTTDGELQCLRSGDTAFVNMQRPLEIFDINTNVEQNQGVEAFIAGPDSFRKRLDVKAPVAVPPRIEPGDTDEARSYRIEIERETIKLGSILLRPLKQETHTDESIQKFFSHQ